MLQSPSVRELEPLLQRKFGNALKILDQRVENLVALGENFSAALLKISVKVRKTVDSTEEELHFVGKSIIVTEDIINWTVLLKKEIYMYTDIIKSYILTEEINSTSYKKNIRTFFPYLCGYRMSLDPKKDKADEDAIILLENVKVQGYYIMDKKIGLDFKHATQAIKALACFHALGIATKVKYPSTFEKFIVQADAYGYSTDEDFHGVIFDNFVSVVRTLPSQDKYIERVERIVAKRKSEGLKFEAVRDDLWSTIAHNDFWTNNIMFRRDEATGEIDGLKIIDFQAYAFADLFVDIYYFMCTSLDDDAKCNRFDDLLAVYYEQFVSVLEGLGVDVGVYSKEKFDGRLKKDAWFELFHCAFALSFFLCEPRGGDRQTHLENILSFKGGDLFLKKLQDLLVIYDERGWLD